MAKIGLDDFLVAGRTVDDLLALMQLNLPPKPTKRKEQQEPQPEQQEPITKAVVSLDQCHKTFQRWLGEGYDPNALNATLAAAAVERLTGDPVWLLVISGSGNAKTETVVAVTGAGALMTSTISSEGALLSATAKKDRDEDATGGLLRRIGPRGILVIKDFTSILSLDRNLRGRILAALRDIYDGHWDREVGQGGGHVLTYDGRIVIIAAVTTKWDTAHDVISAMGDRFVLCRMDSADKTIRTKVGKRAIQNVRLEQQMRAELAEAAGGVINGTRTDVEPVNEQEIEILLAAADLVTLARTSVEYDGQGRVVDAHAPEVPTRFLKQLAQIVYGGVAIGLDREEAMRLAIHCARSTMPPLRLAIVDDLANPEHKDSSVDQVRRRIRKPWTTVDRQLEALYVLGVLDMTEAEEYGVGGKLANRKRYSLADGINPAALTSPEMLLTTTEETKKRGSSDQSEDAATGIDEPLGAGTNKSGDVPGPLCEVCLQPMIVTEEGQTTHPNCDDQDRVTGGPYMALADLDEYRRRRLIEAKADFRKWVDNLAQETKSATVADIDAAEKLRKERS
jgi:hypothetical protein